MIDRRSKMADRYVPTRIPRPVERITRKTGLTSGGQFGGFAAVSLYLLAEKDRSTGLNRIDDEGDSKCVVDLDLV